MAELRKEIPKGAAAEAELRRIRRNEQRQARRRRKKIEELADKEGITFEKAEARIVAEERATPQPATKAANPELITRDPDTIDPDSLEMPTVESLKRDLMIAFHALGGVQGLTSWGRRNPKEFYALWGKYCLPDPDEDTDSGGNSLEAMIKRLDQAERSVN